MTSSRSCANVKHFYVEVVNSDIHTTRGLQGGNIKICGANNFMLRDGVCDDATNTKVCHWDGGDCCLDKFTKDTSYCIVK